MTEAFAYLPVIDRPLAALIPPLTTSLEAGLTPSTDDQVERMITKIALLYPAAKLSDIETEARLELYVELLREIPFDILSRAFRSMAQTSRFFPSVAEIRTAAAPEWNKRRMTLIGLRALLSKHEREWQPPITDRPSPEDIARIKAEVAAMYPSREQADPTTTNHQGA